jgi:DNA-binding protein H-NS
LISVICGNMTFVTAFSENRIGKGGSMSKKVEFQSMSVDQLWSIHEEISSILSARIKAEKYELEKRLAVLNRGFDVINRPGDSRLINGKQRRKYPRVLPKYRNPQTFETWSGRGKRPRWLVAAMKFGHKIEEFRILGGEGAKLPQRA